MLTQQRFKRPILSTRGASGYAGPSQSKLEKLRVTGGGPRYIKIGRRVYYDPDDLDEWLADQKRLSTSAVRLAENRISSESMGVENHRDMTPVQTALKIRLRGPSETEVELAPRKLRPRKPACSDHYTDRESHSTIRGPPRDEAERLAVEDTLTHYFGPNLAAKGTK
jgi:hypothetical protein